jgi:predicted ester cyclase
MDDTASVVTRYREDVMNGHNLDVLDEILAPDYVRHAAEWEGGDLVSCGACKEMLGGLLAVFPDMRIVEGSDRVDMHGDFAYQMARLTGTHSGAAFLGVEPTGKTFEFDYQATMRFEDGRIAEEWLFYDSLLLMQQLGVVPALAAA